MTTYQAYRLSYYREIRIYEYKARNLADAERIAGDFESAANAGTAIRRVDDTTEHSREILLVAPKPAGS